jgi:methionine-rich copper-binding protein CopC
MTDTSSAAASQAGKAATVDTTKPVLVKSSPQDNATNVPLNSDIVLTFSENVVPGAGSIILSNGAGDTRAISVSDASQITFSGSTVTINPLASLDPNGSYSVKMSGSAIYDTAGNAFAGISDASTLNFSTPDNQPPRLLQSNPQDNARNVAVAENIVLTFNENVMAGKGSIVISNGQGDTRNIAVSDASQVSISGGIVTINPLANFKPNSSYYVKIADGAIVDTSGNAYIGINTTSGLNFKTGSLDKAPPRLISSSPANDATAVAVGGNIVLTFNENVMAGSGDIVISDGAGDIHHIAIDDASQVMVKGTTVTINPSADLKPSTFYSVQLPAGLVYDTAGNAYAGGGSAPEVQFTTQDTIPPTLVASSPANQASAVAVDSNIVLVFSEDIAAGNGSIVISNGVGDSRSIPASDTSQVSITGHTLAINPAEDLLINGHYSVQVGNGVILDTAGNSYVGSLSFSTPDTLGPLLVSSVPADNAAAALPGANILLTFDENILSGSGDIVISNGAGDTRTISVADSGQVAINGTTLAINPSQDLNANSHYSVQLAAGLVTDTVGNPYAGIADDTTLDFNTKDITPPLLFSSSPADNAVAVAANNNLVLVFSEAVKPGSGNIVISNGAGDTRNIAVADTGQVNFNGNTVTINPAQDWLANSNYNVQMAAGVIQDLSGNAYSGINNASALNFSTPLVLSSPPVKSGTAGNDIIDANQGSISGAPIVFDAGAGNDYYVIGLSPSNSVASGSNIRISGFGSGDKLLFDLTGGDGFGTVDALYAIVDDGHDISLLANNAGTVQYITLVGLNGDRSGVGGAVDSVSELSRFLGYGSVDFV